MKEIINKVRITGELVKNGIEEFVTKKGEAAIGGSLVLRTADGSEHEIDFYSGKFKKDSNGVITSEEAYFYKEYAKAMKELRDISKCVEGQKPDIISISDGFFTDNDFKGKDGKVVSSNKISARFINIVEPKDYDTTVLEAKFEVEGVITTLKDEIVKDVPTGNLTIVLNHVATAQIKENDKYTDKYEAIKLVPVKMTVRKEMADAFKAAGYYEGCFTKFAGVVVNSVEKVVEIEQQAFGENIEKVFSKVIRLNDIKSGSAVSTIFDHELTQEVVDQLVAKRKQKLAEIANGITPSFTPAGEKTATTPPPVTRNPFAQAQ